MNTMADLFASAQQSLFEAAAPLLFGLGLGNWVFRSNVTSDSGRT